MNLPPIVMDARDLMADRRFVAHQVVKLQSLWRVRLACRLMRFAAKLGGFQIRVEKAD